MVGSNLADHAAKVAAKPMTPETVFRFWDSVGVEMGGALIGVCVAQTAVGVVGVPTHLFGVETRLMIEALAQAAGILAFVTADVVPDESTRFFFVGIDKARFRKPVEPGDQLILTATLERSFKGIWKFNTVAYVGDNEVTSAEMMVAPETNKSAPKVQQA